ncbi:hypothetical protein R1flu_021412 [Riccia fluitans]|uniref:Deoxyhypusine hydroxylase n=1 Tax=Riccia fluitans TaxID=41844 RepID=A0ABD1ZSL5_9MARC
MGAEDCGVSGAVTQDYVVKQLLDVNLNIAERWRALFSLRNMKGRVPREALIKAMRDDSNLLAHEAAFALGQMQDVEAIPALRAVLEDVHSCASIVRHEAAEALGAIGEPEAIALLKDALVSDPAPEVRETCELALRRIEQAVASTADQDADQSPFLSVDPAAAAPSSSSIADLRKILLDEEQGMYERYGAMFALRNRGGPEAVESIVAALGCKSALLRHEVAYVLGQLQDKSSTSALMRTLRDSSEHPMVRHEAAEALGSIGDSESVALLKTYREDSEPLVSQSCEVALNVLDYEVQGKSLEFLYLETPVA